MVQPLWKTIWNFLKKLKSELPFDPAIPVLGLYTNNPETPIQKNLCTSKFIAIQASLKKAEKSQINNLTLHLQELEEQQQTKPRVSRRKEIRSEKN